MNLKLAVAGALTLACLASPVSAQVVAPSALEWAVAQGPTRAQNAQVRPGFARRVIRAESALGRVSTPLDIRSAPQIVAEAARYVGSRNPTGFRGPWCKAFVNLVARRAGYAINASLRARDTLAAGRRIAGPVPGALRVTPHHVSIVAAVRGGRVLAISGNNGRRRVGWSHYSARGARYVLLAGG